MQPLRITRHARNRMRRDGISLETMRQCIDAPDATSASFEGRTNYWKRIDGQYLRVTAIQESGLLVIITTT